MRQKHTSQCQLKKTYQSQTIASRNGNSLTEHEDKPKSFCYLRLQAWPQRVFLHTLFLEYATETGGNKCRAVFYTYRQIAVRSLELFWPCSILAKNPGDVLARGLSYQGLKAFEARPQSAFRPGLKGLEALLLKGVVLKGHISNFGRFSFFAGSS